MHLAWQNLLHAQFLRKGTNIYFRTGKGNRLYKRDKHGQKQSWDLQTCLDLSYKESNPIRANVEFFIGLRNSIEHRFERSLVIATAAHAHAYVINFEAELTRLFGVQESLADELRFPVFIQSLSPEGMDEQRALRRGLPLEAKTYISEFEASIPITMRQDPRFEYRIQLQPLRGVKDEADLAFKFINAKELSEEELAEAMAAGKTGKVLIFEKLKASGFDDEMLPANAAKAVQEQTKFRFSVNDFTKLRHRDGVGPKAGQAPSASFADGTNCIYSTAHKNHVYTKAYIASLIEELSDPQKHEKALSRTPEPPPS
ncbi:DUF3644 domain-containing protein [Paenarthrobacter aurescens]|nr:DUF3644 domain-containing protein [Paenarthrobacter aurescens]MDO6143357.1 DUF3644 domain-containing protein [Paenarthrobacter aurescens]MDO6147205.1 DUF3644 domain-containing protein [Paenarthrobacter aurescens]MDO6158449.1 DUF3644 domain-containing protein [Paenarthrobacter aurescens]MDO6162433.1 DUF3644 domain-containing protein [Paenarthrobacter aurescens]